MARIWWEKGWLACSYCETTKRYIDEDFDMCDWCGKRWKKGKVVYHVEITLEDGGDWSGHYCSPKCIFEEIEALEYEGRPAVEVKIIRAKVIEVRRNDGVESSPDRSKLL